MPLNLSPNATLGRSTLHNAARLGPSNLSFPSDFDPRSLPNLAAWFDARYPAGFGGALPADGTALAQWNDLSGNGRHATQATGSQQPLFRSANPNLLTYNQATVETDTTGLAALNGNSTIARSTTDAAHGTASLQVTSVAAGLTGANTLTGSSGVPVAASTQYTAVISAKAPTITANWTPIIYWWKANGTASATPSSSGTAGALTASYAQRSVTATSPSDAAFATVGFSWTAVAASEVVRVDKLGWAAGSSTTWLPPVTLPNGLATVQFDGNDDVISATCPALNVGNLAIYAVVELMASTPTVNRRILQIVGGAPCAIVQNSSSGLNSAVLGAANPNTSALPAQTAAVVTVESDGTSSRIYRNGTLGSSDVAASGTAGTTANIGSDGTIGVFGGGITALLVYSAAHTTAQRQAVERWLGGVYGVSVA